MEAPVNIAAIKRGDYLLAHGCAFRITKKTESGFRFYCVNGDWEGELDRAGENMRVANEKEWLPVRIERHAAGSHALSDMHYNELIQWLEGRSA